MKTSTILLTLLPIALAAPQAQDDAPVAATDFLSLGFNPPAASYLAAAYNDPAISSAFVAVDTAVAAALSSASTEPTAALTLDSAGNFNPTDALSGLLADITVAPSADRAVVSSVVYGALALEASASAMGNPASSGAAAGAAPGSTTTSHAAAPRQTMAVGLMGAMVAGVAGLAVGL